MAENAEKGRKAPAVPRDILSVALLLVAGAITPLLDSTMVNIALNDFAESFSVTVDVVQWITTAYTLAMAVSVPFSGYFVKRFDGKQVFLAAELGFLVASLAAGLSQSIWFLIGVRLAQGFCAGIIMPLLTTLVMQAAGQRNVGQVMSIVTMPIVLGPILGPILGGLIVANLSWHWIFFINVPIGIVVSVLLWAKLPSFPPAGERPHLDLIGIALLAGLSASLIYGISGISTVGLSSPRTYGFIALGLALAVAYVLWARHMGARSVMPLRLFSHRNFVGAFLGLFFAGCVINGPMLLLPLFFQNVRQYAVVIAACAMIPQGVGMFAARPLIGRLTDQVGARWVVVASTALTVVGTVPMAFFGSDTPYWLIAVVLLVRGMGVGGITLPMTSDSFVGMEPSLVPEASVGARVIQNIGGATGSALIATIIAAGMAGAPSVATYTTAYQGAFAASSVMALIVLLPAMLLTNRIGARRAAGGAGGAGRGRAAAA